MDKSKILVVVPAYNESGNIKKTVADLLSLSLPLSVLVIDDGSFDATAKEAKETPAHVISLPFNIGIGGAVQTGFQFALKEEFEIVVQVDGDGQHDVSYLKELIAPLRKNQADLIVGSRFLPPHLGYRSSFIRRLGIHFFAHLISMLTGFTVTDPTSGFRAYNQKMIRVFAKDYPVDFPEPEAIMIAKKVDAKLMEVPVRMRKRETGHSSIRYLVTLYYMIKVTFAIVLSMLKKKRKVE